DPYNAEMILREKFGGSLPIQIIVSGDYKDPVTLKTMRYLEKYIETDENISHSESMARIIAQLNYVMNDRYMVPSTPEGVNNLWFLMEGEDIYPYFVSEKEKELLILGKIKTMSTEVLVEVVEKIDNFLGGLPDKMVVVNLNELDSRLKPLFFEKKAERVFNTLKWDLEKRGFEISETELRMLVDKVLNSKNKVKIAPEFIAGKIKEYLLSSESEVELQSPEKINYISYRIADPVVKDINTGIEKISSILKAELTAYPEDDIILLSESLREVINESYNEVLVNTGIDSIMRFIPQKYRDNEGLLKELKGDLWAANDEFVILDYTEFEKISELVDPPIDRIVSVKLIQTGIAPVLNRMEEELTPTQVESILLALIFVVLLLSFIFRSFLAGVIGVIPILLTILSNFSIMGYLKISLDSYTAMIASIAIGLGIDYAIHFISRYKYELKRSGDYLTALMRTIPTTGLAIVINALSVGLGFTVLLFAGGQHIRRFGGLTALTMFLSAIFTLFVLSSIFVFIKPRFLKSRTPGEIEGGIR
ncbi:MAG: MMPL family transporter, partial [Fidelibacterota bacterium]